MSAAIIPQCPSCSRVLYFSHEDTTIITCSCGTVVERKEGGVLLSKPYYLIHHPYDRIQPGTTGKWQGKDFKVLGRFRVWLEESVYNYWTILFSDGELTYLGEGYGFYGIMSRTKVEAAALIHLNTSDIKDDLSLLPDEKFVLEKNNKVSKWELEGEVYLPERNEQFRIFEFSSANRQITLFQFLPQFTQAFEVAYTSFDALEFTNTRIADLPKKTFSCNSCSNEIVVKTYPYAQSCACIHCGTHHLLRDGSFRSFNQRNSTDIGPDIELGSTAVIKGILYECIGYTLKEENNQYASRWKEYTLYNREEGYAFLSEFEGNWIFLREQGKTPVTEGTKPSISFMGEPFQLYNSYLYSIINAAGEFPDNIFNSSDTACKEFISPPEVWIQEYNKREGIVWFLGEHISGKELSSQFNFPEGLPQKNGIGPVEPRFFVSPFKLLRTGVLGLLALCLLHILVSFTKQERVVVNKNFLFNDSTHNVSFVTDKFHLDKWRSNLEFSVYAPVDNDWVEWNATLVNAKTGKEYTVEKGVEYYHGVSGGESWSEGSRHSKAYITYLPAGDYFIQVQGARNAASVYSPVSGFDLKVTYDVNNNRNLWWSLFFLAIWPIIQYIRINRIEKKRWYNSPFSPYSYED